MSYLVVVTVGRHLDILVGQALIISLSPNIRSSSLLGVQVLHAQHYCFDSIFIQHLPTCYCVDEYGVYENNKIIKVISN